MARRVILIISGAIVLVLVLIVGGIFLVLHSQADATDATSTPTTTVTPAPTVAANPYTQPLKQYAPEIRSQMAQGLKLSPEQLAAQLKAGKTLSAIATAQGLSTVQLQNLIATSLQNSLQPAVTSGDLTQKQVATLVKRWQKNPRQLERLLGARSKATKQPPATATPVE
jgi:flagellar basal body-associated protein FliL